MGEVCVSVWLFVGQAVCLSSVSLSGCSLVRLSAYRLCLCLAVRWSGCLLIYGSMPNDIPWMLGLGFILDAQPLVSRLSLCALQPGPIIRVSPSGTGGYTGCTYANHPTRLDYREDQ